jgi:biotin/methionine sulfoxide reductase
MNKTTHSAHWGSFSVDFPDGPRGRLRVTADPDDPEPSVILGNLPDAPASPVRIDRPMVRRGWLENGPGPTTGRGREPFVPISWEKALDLTAAELDRVRKTHGNRAIFGGSYGWASAGRFHHTQSQLHRFLNLIGGYTFSRDTYSSAAAEVILRRVIAPESKMSSDTVTWDGITERTELLVAFGGMPRRTQAVGVGGVSRHRGGRAIETAVRRGLQIVSISPIRDDLPEAQWLPIRPNTDTAFLLALAHTLVTGNLHNQAFVDRYTVGFEEFRRYLTGQTDGQPKSAAWASALTEVPAQTIVDLTLSMASRRTVISITNSVQRAEFGEQPIWLGVVVAALLGRFSDGEGFAFALGTLGNLGRLPLAVKLPSFPQGENPVADFIPVARISDLLLKPGQNFDYDGHRLAYPDIRLVYWAGGNPFHHHQNLNRLRKAWGRPDTIVVQDPYWTASARHADLVLPSTISLERNDLGAAKNDDRLIAMQQVLPPHGEAKDDFDIFAALAVRFGQKEAFTEGLNQDQWLRRLYAELRASLEAVGTQAPDFEHFWEKGQLALPTRSAGQWMSSFLADPVGSPLSTGSGKIEIASPTIAGFGYIDCPGHPVWRPRTEALGSVRAQRFPLLLVANQPAARLHSQLDFGAASRASKVAGREPIRLHPGDAAHRKLAEGDVVRVFNDRGACLAGVKISSELRPGVVQLSTGAWFDPDEERNLCRHGNPNVLTLDAGTSSLAQGSVGQLVLVEVEKWEGEAPPVRVHRAPATEGERFL